jgi:hypothetical protein
MIFEEKKLEELVHLLFASSLSHSSAFSDHFLLELVLPGERFSSLALHVTQLQWDTKVEPVLEAVEHS